MKFLMCLCRRMTGVVFLEFVNKENTNMVYESKFLEVLGQQFHHTPYKVICSYNIFEFALQRPRINQENTYYTFFKTHLKLSKIIIYMYTFLNRYSLFYYIQAIQLCLKLHNLNSYTNVL